MARKIVDATELKRGDKIVVGPGRVEKVTAPSSAGSHNTVSIHTAEHDIITTLPCPVQVER